MRTLVRIFSDFHDIYGKLNTTDTFRMEAFA